MIASLQNGYQDLIKRVTRVEGRCSRTEAAVEKLQSRALGEDEEGDAANEATAAAAAAAATATSEGKE